MSFKLGYFKSALMAAVALMALGVCFVVFRRSDRIYRDDYGFVHGTGSLQSYYETGELQAEEVYDDGKLCTTTWFRPSGEVVARTNWTDQGEGLWYGLWDNGQVRSVVPMRHHLAGGGVATYFRMDGTMESTVPFREGRKELTEVFYREDGSVERTRQYKAGVLEGRDVIYSKDGAIETTAVFRNGKEVPGGAIHPGR